MALLPCAQPEQKRKATALLSLSLIAMKIYEVASSSFAEEEEEEGGTKYHAWDGKEFPLPFFPPFLSGKTVPPKGLILQSLPWRRESPPLLFSPLFMLRLNGRKGRAERRGKEVSIKMDVDMGMSQWYHVAPLPSPSRLLPLPHILFGFYSFSCREETSFPPTHFRILLTPNTFWVLVSWGGMVVALSPRRKGDTPNTSPLGNKNSPRIRPCTRKVKKTERSSIREAVLFCCRQKTFDLTCPLSHIHLVFMSAFFCTPPCSQSPHPYYTAQRVQNHVPRNSIASSQKGRERDFLFSPSSSLLPLCPFYCIAIPRDPKKDQPLQEGVSPNIKIFKKSMLVYVFLIFLQNRRKKQKQIFLSSRMA